MQEFRFQAGQQVKYCVLDNRVDETAGTRHMQTQMGKGEIVFVEKKPDGTRVLEVEHKDHSYIRLEIDADETFYVQPLTLAP